VLIAASLLVADTLSAGMMGVLCQRARGDAGSVDEATVRLPWLSM